MFAQKWLTSFKRTCLPAGREKRAKARKVDSVTEQVKKVLTDADQRLILMVRG